jgi:hypothetical protein
MLVAALVWALPHTIILLIIVALVWYFYRAAESNRFSLRSLLVLTAGVAAMAAVAAQVPASMMGGGAGVVTQRVLIEVLESGTNALISDAEITLTSRTGNLADTLTSHTNKQGISEFMAKAVLVTRHSMLRTWSVFRTKGWVLRVRALGYQDVKVTLPETVVSGEGEEPIEYQVYLQKSP